MYFQYLDGDYYQDDNYQPSNNRPSNQYASTFYIGVGCYENEVYHPVLYKCVPQVPKPVSQSPIDLSIFG